MQKIQPLAELNDVHGVLAHGCWDGLHVGHIRFLRWSQEIMPSAPLIVTLTADAFFGKGPKRPAFPEDIRAECLAALQCVDFVAIVHETTGILAIETIKPHIYVKGLGDMTLAEEERAVLRNNGRMACLPKETDLGGRVFSSSRLLSGEYA